MVKTEIVRLKQLAEDATEPCAIGDHRRFSDAANPQAIIALIDELEKTKAQLAEANEALDFYNDVNHTADEGKRARQYLEKYKERKT